MLIPPGKRKGTVRPPKSKSHLHRLLIADFLSGGEAWRGAEPGESDDIAATRRCLAALASGATEPVLDCGESGSTLRFMRPLAAALGRKPRFVLRGRLASRPDISYDTLAPGVFSLPGDVSSQFTTGLLFALPLLDGDSEIRFTSQPESQGYVEMTLDVLKASGIEVAATPTGYAVPSRQRYRLPANCEAEADWSGAAFWLAMNHLGSEINVQGLNASSHQPDRVAEALLAQVGGEKDMAQCPDLFPALAAASAADNAVTAFTSTRRLRLKESDRVAAMAAMLAALGVETAEEEDRFVIKGIGGFFKGGCKVATFSDHRIAMAAAVAASHALAPIEIDNADCVAKSYPRFFEEDASLRGNG